MKYNFGTVFTLAIFAFLTTANVQAETQHKMVIAFETDNFDLPETDISSLAIGEAQTIETSSGKVIDILRTADGADIYVDGELLEMNFDDPGLDEEHIVKKHVEIVCDNDQECEENVVFIAGDDSEASGWATADGEKVILHKEVEITCSDDDEKPACGDRMIWISDNEDLDAEELHEGHKFIVVKKIQTTED